MKEHSVKSLSPLLLWDSELDPASRSSPRPHLPARTQPLRLLSKERVPYPQRQPGSPRRTTERWSAAPCPPSLTSREVQCPEFGRRFFLPRPAPRRRRGGATRATGQDYGARRARVPLLPPRLQGRLRVLVREDIPAAGHRRAFCSAQVMSPAAEETQPCTACSPGVPGLSTAGTETLERRGGAMRGGAGGEGAGLPLCGLPHP